jgi:UDP-glucose 4-epimerase
VSKAISGARCLVLGSGGFIGTNLCRGLIQAGATVTGYGRRSPFGAASPGMTWIDRDFADQAALDGAVAEADFVFHLLGGGLPESSNRDPAMVIVDGLLPSLRLLDACRGARIAKLIFVSSGGTVYGPSASLPIAETFATNPNSAYGISKLTVEKYIQLYHHLHGLDYAILRVANPFGPFQNPLRGQGLVSSLLYRAATGQPLEIWGDGSIVRDYVYIDDVVGALIGAAGHSGEARLFNVGSGAGRSVRQVVEDVIALTGAGIVRYRPGRAADVPANVLDCGRIAREIGWTATTAWETGLSRSLDWVRQVGIPLLRP